MPFATNTQGHRIHYRSVGERGPFVALVMGIGVSGQFWADIPERLAEHPEHPHRVLVVDNRGTGGSELPWRPWSIGDMADDVACVLDDAGAQRAIVIGISLGGMIAQHVAIRHPERMHGLGLLCTTPGFPLGALPNPVAVKSLVKGFMNGMKGREFLHLMYPRSQVGRALEILRGESYAGRFKHERFKPRTLLMHLLAAGAHATTARDLAAIRCPTLVVTGDQDVLIPPVNSERLAARIPGAMLRVLPDVGHDILTLAPECVSDAVEWLAAAG